MSQKEEELLAGAGEIFAAGGETFEILDNADIVFPTVHDDKGEEVQLTHGNYISLVESKDRAVRKEAYEGLYKVYEQYQHTYAKTLMPKFANSHLPVERPFLKTLYQKVFMIAWWQR